VQPIYATWLVLGPSQNRSIASDFPLAVEFIREDKQAQGRIQFVDKKSLRLLMSGEGSPFGEFSPDGNRLQIAVSWAPIDGRTKRGQ
jgi:hypothetical protein